MPTLTGLPEFEACAETAHNWYQTSPEVGICIGLLAYLGIVLPLFVPHLEEQANRRKRNLWVAFMSACLLIEFWAIHQDQADHREKDRVANCKQVENFNSIAGKIQQSFEANESHFVATMTDVDATLRAARTAVLQTHPHPSVEFQNFQLPKSAEDLWNGKPFVFTYWFKNVGNADAESVREFAKIYVNLPTGEGSARAFSDFQRDWNIVKKYPPSPIRGKRGHSLSPNEERIGIGESESTSSLINDSQGRVLYLFFAAEFDDKIIGRSCTLSCKKITRSNLQGDACSPTGDRVLNGPYCLTK